jgi:predicted nucleic acid-binding protein
VTSCYLDASALVKLATAESESLALRAWLREKSPLLTSRISAVEVARAMGRKDASSAARGREATRDAFTSVAIAELDAGIANRAAELGPASLRALDAIHLATALAIGDELTAFVTYDMRLADAARAAGLEVVAPAP